MTKTNYNNPELSACHQAPVHVVGDSFGDGTNHYECDECGHSCDLFAPSTNYNERLDNLWAEIHFKENGIPSVHAGPLTEKTKTEITQLFKDLVAEAKPPAKNLAHADKINIDMYIGYNTGQAEFEQNILELLEAK